MQGRWQRKAVSLSPSSQKMYPKRTTLWWSSRLSRGWRWKPNLVLFLDIECAVQERKNLNKCSNSSGMTQHWHGWWQNLNLLVQWTIQRKTSNTEWTDSSFNTSYTCIPSLTNSYQTPKKGHPPCDVLSIPQEIENPPNRPRQLLIGDHLVKSHQRLTSQECQELSCERRGNQAKRCETRRGDDLRHWEVNYSSRRVGAISCNQHDGDTLQITRRNEEVEKFQSIFA